MTTSPHLAIRPETPDDAAAIEAVTMAAFRSKTGDVHRLGVQSHLSVVKRGQAS